MLAPEDRELLMEAIRPAPGYTLDHALITTYSLDLDALLGIPVALTFNSWTGGEDPSAPEGGDQTERLDPVALLHSLRKTAERLTVVGQAGALGVPRSKGFLAFLEPLVYGVSAPSGGIFHPKLWLLRYQPPLPGDPVRYKLLCLTRNLTFNRTWDAILRLEATLDADGPERPGNAPLKTFVEGVAGLAARTQRGLDEARRAHLRQMAEESLRLDFELPEGFEELAFWPLGFDSTSAEDVFAGRRDRTLVVSPFVVDGFIERFGLGPDDTLISRPEELALLREDTLARPGRISVFGDLATAEPEPAEDEAEGAEETGTDDALSGLHAKAFIADAGPKARTWIGSANATSSAFSTNVEFVVELLGPKEQAGIEAVLGGTDGSGLESLLVPYVHDPGLAEDAALRELKRRIDEVAEALATADLELHARSDGAAWQLSLEPTEALPDLPADLEIAVWPATLADERARPIGDPSEGLKWERLGVTQLTGFLCASIRSTERSFERRLAMALPLRGAPEGREAAVIRTIVASPSRLVSYLLMVLGGDVEEGVDPTAELAGESEGPSPWLGLAGEPTLFEALVRALHRDPSRIDTVEKLLEDLGEDSTLLPDGFDSVFDPVREARRSIST